MNELITGSAKMYRDLLKKYMNHISKEVGVTYVDCINDALSDNVGIDSLEKMILLQIKKEILNE